MSYTETGNVFQSLKLPQTVSQFFGNFSNMFVAELVVYWLVSTILFDANWEVCSFTCTLKEFHTGEVSSVLVSVYAQEKHCT